MILNKKKHTLNKGFMLVEMLVSITIFSVVMIVGAGSLLSIIDANRRSHSFKIVVNNLNLAVESISRDARFGYNYNCESPSGGDCVAGGTIFYLNTQGGDSVVYRLNGTAIEKSVNDSAFIAVTAPEIIIDNLTFYVLGSDTGDTIQPKLVIVVKGHSGSGVKSRMDFGLQTVVSQRVRG